MSENFKKLYNTEEWIAGLEGEEKARMQEVWDIAGRAAGGKSQVDSDASDVWGKIQKKIHSDNKSSNPGIYSVNARLYLMAAVLLIGAGIFVWVTFFSASSYYSPYGEVTTLQLDDLTTVELNNGSKLTIQRGFTGKHRTVELEGEAYFDVAAHDIPFIVQTHNAAVEVLGTRFAVRSWPEETGYETYVALESGSLSFFRYDAEEDKVILNPGQVRRLSGHQTKPVDVTGFVFDDYFAWRDRNLSFTSRPFASVLSELERRFNINIRLDDKSRHFKNREITIYYHKPEDPETVLRDIAGGLGLNVEIVNNHFRVY